MTKIAIIGSIRQEGWSILKNKGYDVSEITDFSSTNLIEKLQDVEGISLRTLKLTGNILEKCKKLHKRS